ncbi:MAG: glycine zipper family protein [Vicinamibacterales bacterium]
MRNVLAATIAINLALAAWSVADAQQMYFYPSRGQSAAQQTTDRGECHVWSVSQTGFDPTNPHVATTAPPPAAPTGGVVRGAARGAAVGAVGGAIAGDAGKGAAVGAATGGMIGGIRRVDRAQQQAAYQQQQQAALQQGQSAYARALSACMQGRGYAVQ